VVEEFAGSFVCVGFSNDRRRVFPPVFPCPDQVAQAAAGTVVQIAVVDGLWPVDRIAAYRNYKNRLVAIQVLQLPCIHVGFLAPAAVALVLLEASLIYLNLVLFEEIFLDKLRHKMLCPACIQRCQLQTSL